MASGELSPHIDSNPVSTTGTGFPTSNNLQDYLTYTYIEAMQGVVEERIGVLGDQLGIHQKALNLLNQVQRAATDTNFAIQSNDPSSSTKILTNWRPSPSNTNNRPRIGAYLTTLKGSNGLQSQLQFLLAGGQVEETAKAMIERVIGGLNTISGSANNSTNRTAFSKWYGEETTQQDLRNAIASVSNISTIQVNRLKEVIFIYEQFIKGASSLQNAVDQLLNSLANAPLS